MYRAITVKSALEETKGLVVYENRELSEKIDHFAILEIDKKRHIVTLPKYCPISSTGDKKRYKGMLWLINLNNGAPTLSSRYFHFFDQRGKDIHTAVKNFNKYYKNSEYEPGQIVEVFSF